MGAEKIIDRSKKNSRRRKKRRTEDFSSDSSSSSDSSDNEEKEVPTKKVVEEVTPKAKTRAITVDEAFVLSDDEESNNNNNNNINGPLEPLSEETHKKLSNIKLTSTILSNSTGFGNQKGKNVDVNQVREKLNKDRAQLNNEYLMLMASSFGNDLDELRKSQTSHKNL